MLFLAPSVFGRGAKRPGSRRTGNDSNERLQPITSSIVLDSLYMYGIGYLK